MVKCKSFALKGQENWILEMSILFRGSCSSLLKPTVLTVVLENRVLDDSDANE